MGVGSLSFLPRAQLWDTVSVPSSELGGRESQRAWVKVSDGQAAALAGDSTTSRAHPALCVWGVGLEAGNAPFSAATSLLRLLPYSSTLKVRVRSGILMVYSPTGASAASGKDRSTMPPTGVTSSHCAIRFPLGSCTGIVESSHFPVQKDSFAGCSRYQGPV